MASLPTSQAGLLAWGVAMVDITWRRTLWRHITPEARVGDPSMALQGLDAHGTAVSTTSGSNLPLSPSLDASSNAVHTATHTTPTTRAIWGGATAWPPGLRMAWIAYLWLLGSSADAASASTTNVTTSANALSSTDTTNSTSTGSSPSPSGGLSHASFVILVTMTVVGGTMLLLLVVVSWLLWWRRKCSFSFCRKAFANACHNLMSFRLSEFSVHGRKRCSHTEAAGANSSSRGQSPPVIAVATRKTYGFSGQPYAGNVASMKRGNSELSASSTFRVGDSPRFMGVKSAMDDSPGRATTASAATASTAEIAAGAGVSALAVVTVVLARSSCGSNSGPSCNRRDSTPTRASSGGPPAAATARDGAAAAAAPVEAGAEYSSDGDDTVSSGLSAVYAAGSDALPSVCLVLAPPDEQDRRPLSGNGSSGGGFNLAAHVSGNCGAAAAASTTCVGDRSGVGVGIGGRHGNLLTTPAQQPGAEATPKRPGLEASPAELARLDEGEDEEEVGKGARGGADEEGGRECSSDSSVASKAERHELEKPFAVPEILEVVGVEETVLPQPISIPLDLTLEEDVFIVSAKEQQQQQREQGEVQEREEQQQPETPVASRRKHGAASGDWMMGSPKATPAAPSAALDSTLLEGRFAGRPVSVRVIRRDALGGGGGATAFDGRPGDGRGSGAGRSSLGGGGGGGRISMDEELRWRVREEAAARALCRHPNVVELLGAGSSPSGGEVFFVEEHLPTSLAATAHQGEGLSLRRALGVALDITLALSYIHLQRDGIHGDLRPANVLLDSSGIAKITGGFGLLAAGPAAAASPRVSRLSPAGAYRTRHAASLAGPHATPRDDMAPDGRTAGLGGSAAQEAGIAPYTAPECFDLGAELEEGGTGQPAARYPVTQKADMYSFGVLLWEMLSRQRPWRGLGPTQIAFVVGYENQRLVIPSNDRFPPQVVELILQCWEQDPSKRPGAAEVARRLSAMIVQLPTRGSLVSVSSI